VPFDISQQIDLAGSRSLARRPDRIGAPFNPNRKLEKVGQSLCEKSGAAEGIHQQAAAGPRHFLDNLEQACRDTVIDLAETTVVRCFAKRMRTVLRARDPQL
jgi:hypothetical protein